MPFIAVYETSHGEQYRYKTFKAGDGQWYLATSSGYEPLTYVLTAIDAVFAGYEYQSSAPDAQKFETRPPEPTRETDAGNPSERKFGQWTIATAVRRMRALSSAAFDELRTTDEDFRSAIDASENISATVTDLPRPYDDAGKRYTKFAALSPPQQRYMQAKRNVAHEKKFALRIDGSGVKWGGIFYGVATATCECGKRYVEIPLSAWVNDEIKDCGCGVGDEYHVSGRRLDGRERR